MKMCPKCGNKVFNRANYCYNCGHEFKKEVKK
jgi:uncharacterized OB-fold protein